MQRREAPPVAAAAVAAPAPSPTPAPAVLEPAAQTAVPAAKPSPRRPAAVPQAEQAPAAAPAAAATVPPSRPEPAAPRLESNLPPEVEERRQVPATYSALVAAGELPAPKLKTSGALAPVDKDDHQPRPTFVSADRISGRNDVETVAEGEVELRRADKTLNADHLTYWHAEDEVEATGHVRLEDGEDVIRGPRLRMKVEENTGFFETPDYTLKRVPVGIQSHAPVTGSGEADRLEFQGEGVYRFVNGTYSTCTPDQRDWYVRAEEMQLDYNREVGEAKNAKLYFEGTPILYSPWLNFSLNNQRKSGLLTPTLGTNSINGIQASLPWYWNIAPNMDATITPREMSKRGFLLGGEFRYLDYNYSGQDRLEYLPSDRLTGTRRYAYSIVHNQNFGRGLTGNLNLNGASDGTYFTDLSSNFAAASQSYLVRQGSLSLSRDWWSATLIGQHYQVLQDPSAPALAVPYSRLPWWTLTAVRPDLPAGLVFNMTGEYVNFSHPTNVVGKRITAYPQISLPLQTAAFSVTPKIGVNSTRYVGLERQAAGVPEQITRTLPVFSVDSSVVFERDVNWFDRSLTQTLEPRLYYLYIPYRDQSNIPVFDTGIADFNFAQIFSENRYSGGDRIADANQATTALVSRIVDPDSGTELMRGMIGQRFYFDTQHVTLPGEVPRSSRKTDLLAAFSGLVMPKTYVDTAWQYSQNFHRTERLNFGGRYQPETMKVLNAGYRYTRDQLGQLDVSGQWPLGGRWYGVGRYNYSLKDARMLETVGGLEYDGGCWVLRLVIQRLAVQTLKASTAFFVQLELNGFAKLGSNPADILKRNVPGYSGLNQPGAESDIGIY